MSATVSNALPQSWQEAIAIAAAGSGPDWLQALRRDAAGSLERSGLPDRKTEAWKYTPLKAFEALDPPLTGEAAAVFEAESCPPALSQADVTVTIGDGTLLDIQGDQAQGVSVLPLSEAFTQFEDRLRPLFEGMEIDGPSRAFAALNSAFLGQGLVVHVGANVDAGRLLIRWAFSSSDVARMGHFRVILLCDQGARLDLLEQFQSALASPHALNVVIHAELDDGAELNHVRLQTESPGVMLLTSTAIRQATESRYIYRGFDLGGGLVRHELTSTLSGPEAFTDISGAFVLDERRHVDNHVSVTHDAIDCRSEQFFRGVLGGRSRGVFNGRALIQPGADGSSVQQSNANLLLSPLAEMDTKPELEIYADEVEASHGATVGQLDESSVFYLRTRGLSASEARRMLTAAFCHAVTDRLRDRQLAGQIAELVDAVMPAGGETSNEG